MLSYDYYLIKVNNMKCNNNYKCLMTRITIINYMISNCENINSYIIYNDNDLNIINKVFIFKTFTIKKNSILNNYSNLLSNIN